MLYLDLEKGLRRRGKKREWFAIEALKRRLVLVGSFYNVTVM